MYNMYHGKIKAILKVPVSTKTCPPFPLQVLYNCNCNPRPQHSIAPPTHTTHNPARNNTLLTPSSHISPPPRQSNNRTHWVFPSPTLVLSLWLPNVQTSCRSNNKPDLRCWSNGKMHETGWEGATVPNRVCPPIDCRTTTVRGSTNKRNHRRTGQCSKWRTIERGIRPAIDTT